MTSNEESIAIKKLCRALHRRSQLFSLLHPGFSLFILFLILLQQMQVQLNAPQGETTAECRARPERILRKFSY